MREKRRERFNCVPIGWRQSQRHLWPLVVVVVPCLQVTCESLIAAAAAAAAAEAIPMAVSFLELIILFSWPPFFCFLSHFVRFSTKLRRQL